MGIVLTPLGSLGNGDEIGIFICLAYLVVNADAMRIEVNILFRQTVKLADAKSCPQQNRNIIIVIMTVP